MKKLLFFFLVLGSNILVNAQTTGNTIKGLIKISGQKKAILNKGTSYTEEGIAISDEKKRIDFLNSPEKNIYISCHPLSFQPVVKPIKNVKITQREKTFFPNIVAVTKGSTIQFINEDEVYHNVFSLSKARFNIGRRPTGNVYGQKINKVGIIKLGCDIHAEMSAVILSLNTPYFTKIEEDGTYEINSLPDGSYELRVYHPTLQKYKVEVNLKGHKVLTKDVQLLKKA